jgi:protein-tyrosine phosphatase
MSVNVLFVCLGNICRSPMAEAVFHQMVKTAGLEDKIKVDSAGTGSWHEGETAHPGTLRVLRQHGIVYKGRARQVRPQDFTSPNSYIIVMDQSNLDNVRRLHTSHAHVYRLLDFASQSTQQSHGLDVPDPYYTGNFETVYQLVEESCRNLFATIRQQEGL